MARRVRSADEGFTFVEVLLALVIFTVAGILFALGVGVAVQSSDRHRDEATIQTILRDQAEGLYAAAATCSSGSALTYTPGSVSGYNISVAYADPSGTDLGASPTCPAIDSYVAATVSAQSTDGRSHDSTVTIVLRTP